MLNLDNLDDSSEEEKYVPKQHKDCPRLYSHTYVVGKTGSGKTNFVYNFLLGPYKMDYTRVYLLIPGDEPKVDKIQKRFHKLSEKVPELGRVLHRFRDYKDIPELSEEDKNHLTLLIIDDMITARPPAKIMDYFIRGRKYNFTIFFLSQTYRGGNVTIRSQCSNYILFNVDNKELGKAMEEISAVHKDTFIKWFRECQKTPYTPLCYINNEFRKGISERL